MQRLGYNAIATLLFASNIVFWRQSGYFDVQSDYNPLLHTWSLAVEEQFYVLFPILLILIYRWARNSRIPILLGLLLFSFTLCILFQQRLPGATFYLSPFRAWELLAGSVLAIGNLPHLKNRAANEVLAWTSVAGLIGCFILIREDEAFPGWIAAAPVLATAGLIHSGAGPKTLVSSLLGLRGVVFVGLISYSLYLWHWPIFVYASYTNGYADFSAPAIAGLVLLSMVLAYLTYRWVETPFRKREPGAIFYGNRKIFRAAALASLVVGLFAIVLILDNGWRSRVPSRVAKLDDLRTAPIAGQECNGLVPDRAVSTCNAVEAGQRADMLLWGDSHAMAWSPALRAHAKASNKQFALGVNSACPPLLGIDNPAARGCTKFNDDMFTYIKKSRPVVVYLVASWLSYSIPDGQYALRGADGETGNARLFALALHRTINTIQPYTDRIVLVGPTPGAPHETPYRLAIYEWKNWGPKPLPISRSQHDSRSRLFRLAASEVPDNRNLTVVDPTPWFCNASHCIYERSNTLLYKDNGHLSQDGAAFVRNMLMQPQRR